MKRAPKVLTRMRLSCCWGDNLDEKKLNEVVDYIDDLEQQVKKQKEVIDNTIEYIRKNRKEISKYQSDNTDFPLKSFMWDIDDVLNILKGDQKWIVKK